MAQPGTITIDGRTIAGPLLAPMPKSDQGVIDFHLSSVDSASVLLLAAYHSPLLAVSAPASAAQGSVQFVNVTCYNPSPAPFSGSLSLDIPADWRLSAPQPAVKIAARSSRRITITVRIGDSPGRWVVKAVFDQSSNVGPVVSVPADVIVTP